MQSVLQTSATRVTGIKDINYTELDCDKGVLRYNVSDSAQQKIDAAK